ncbi:MAG: hypothetical protein M1548_09745 [Actinobacteria bacterium]|nr:hypothetical protein [Actinomycetota bacterium]
MRREICSICGKGARSLWLFNLAKYNSLDEKSRMRFDICEDCARKLMSAMKAIMRQHEEDLLNGLGESRLVCPICSKERSTVEPKVPTPCESCGTIFSVYSAAGKK